MELFLGLCGRILGGLRKEGINMRKHSLRDISKKGERKEKGTVRAKGKSNRGQRWSK